MLTNQVDKLCQERRLPCRNPRKLSILTGTGLTHMHCTHGLTEVAGMYSPKAVLSKHSQSRR